MSLDATYGAGALQALTDICRAAGEPYGWSCDVHELEGDHADGLVVAWTDAEGEQAKWTLSYRDEGRWAHNNSLSITDPARRGTGMLAALAKSTEWWVSVGVKWFTLEPEGEAALAAFSSIGFEPLLSEAAPQIKFGTEAPATKVLEYVAWREGGQQPNSEPSWHRELRVGE